MNILPHVLTKANAEKSFITLGPSHSSVAIALNCLSRMTRIQFQPTAAVVQFVENSGTDLGMRV